MKRILIEFFSGRTPENLISLLKERFDEIHFLVIEGIAQPSRKEKDSISEVVFKILGFEPHFCTIPKKEIPLILTELEGIFCSNASFQIDITGGDEAFLCAAGIWMERHRDQNIFLHQYDIRSGEKIFSYPPQNQIDPPFVHHLSISQLLKLNGSVLHSALYPNFSFGTLRSEVLRLWKTVKNHPKEWNDFCSMSAASGGTKSSMTQKCLGKKGANPRFYQLISQRLKNAGILQNEKRVTIGGKDYMEFSLAVPKEALFLYDKGGNVLEMFSALAAYESGLFHEIAVGVHVNWDGSVSPSKMPDPKNEIDVFALRENLPLLISCKNNAPENQYLYEIMIMSKHYGGYFSTPMLFATGRASPTVRKRAEEMGIILIDSIRHLSVSELSDLIKDRLS